MDKRILVVCQRFWPENNQINDICEGFIERGYEVDVLCGQPNYPSGEFYKGYNSFGPGKEEHGKLTIFRTMEIKKSNYSNIRIFLNYVTFPIAAFFKKFALRKRKYDAVFIYQLSPVMMSGVGLSIGMKRRIPTTMFVQDVWPESFYNEIEVKSFLFNKILVKLSQWYYRRATRLIVTSESVKSHLTREMFIPASKIRCMQQFPYKSMERDRRDENIMDRYAGSFNIMFIGDITNEFSFDTILEAAERIDRHAIRDIRFIIVGDGLNLPEFKEKVYGSNLHDYFYFEENVSSKNYPKYAYVADVLFACTKMDRASSLSQPAIIANYLAAGKPLLLAMGSNARKLIREVKCGYASDPDDADRLYDNIMKLYKTPREELKEMGANAKEYQRRAAGREASIDEILDIIFDEGF